MDTEKEIKMSFFERQYVNVSVICDELVIKKLSPSRGEAV